MKIKFCSTLIILLSLSPSFAYAAYRDNYYVTAVLTVPATFWNSFALCTNPDFLTGRPNDGTGSAFGMQTSNATSNEQISTLGFSFGKYGAATTAWTGTFVDEYLDVSGKATETFYPIQSPGPSGSISFNEAINSNAQYDDEYINGKLAVSNVYEYFTTHSSMWVGLFTQGSTAQYFPPFTSGSNCSTMQVYGTSTGGGYEDWGSTLYPALESSDPSGQNTAYGSFNESSDTYYVYPHS